MATKTAAKTEKPAPAAKTAKPAPAKKAEAPAAKTAAAPKKVNSALMKPLKPSAALAAVVGKDPLPRTEVVSKIWDYIRKNSRQNPENKREILSDDKLKAVFGKDKVTMFEMNKLLSAHLS